MRFYGHAPLWHLTKPRFPDFLVCMLDLHVCNMFGRRTEQAKANLDPREAPRVRPRVDPRVRPRDRPRERPRQDTRGLIFPVFSRLRTPQESSHETSHEDVHGSAHESVQSRGRGSHVLFSWCSVRREKHVASNFLLLFPTCCQHRCL